VRLSLAATRPVAGDLVLVADDDVRRERAAALTTTPVGAGAASAGHTSTSTAVVAAATADLPVDVPARTSLPPPPPPLPPTANKNSAVRVLSDADAASGHYSIDDVVLPTPGEGVLIPGHVMSAYTSIIHADRLPLSLTRPPPTGHYTRSTHRDKQRRRDDEAKAIADHAARKTARIAVAKTILRNDAAAAAAAGEKASAALDGSRAFKPVVPEWERGAAVAGAAQPFRMQGAYRKVLERCYDLRWATRVDAAHKTKDDVGSDVGGAGDVDGGDDDGAMRVIDLEFSLKSSTYATMAMRQMIEH
jgi:hypothetical protein